MFRTAARTGTRATTVTRPVLVCFFVEYKTVLTPKQQLLCGGTINFETRLNLPPLLLKDERVAVLRQPER